MSTTASPIDLLKVVNTGDKPLILRHDGKGDITIDPKRFRIVLAEYAYLAFGDPRATNYGKDKARDVEFSNARTAWGFYPGVFSESAWDGVGFDNVTKEPVGPFKPQYECYDMEDNRVYLVLDDPDGTKVAAQSGTPTEAQSNNVEIQALLRANEQMQRQIAELTNLVLMQQTGLPVDQPVEDPDDDFDDEDEDDEEEGDGTEDDTSGAEPEVSDVVKAAAAAATKPAAKPTKAAAKKAAAKGAGEIPKAPDNEPPVTADNPRSTRVGGR